MKILEHVVGLIETNGYQIAYFGQRKSGDDSSLEVEEEELTFVPMAEGGSKKEA